MTVTSASVNYLLGDNYFDYCQRCKFSSKYLAVNVVYSIRRASNFLNICIENCYISLQMGGVFVYVCVSMYVYY